MDKLNEGKIANSSGTNRHYPHEWVCEAKLKAKISQWNHEHPYDKKEFKPIRKVDFTIPNYVKSGVEEEIKNIEEHQDFKPRCCRSL